MNVCSAADHLFLDLMDVSWCWPSWATNHSETFIPSTALYCL